MQQINQVSQNKIDSRSLICLNSQKGLVYLKQNQIDPGAGNNGEVYKGYIGYNTEQQIECCVKKSKLSNNMKQQEKQKKELDIGRRLDHKNIVKFYDSQIMDDNIYIFLEYCDGGSLESKMREIEQKKNIFSEEFAIKIIQQIIDALVYMKQCNFDGKQGAAHRDIKPDNIVFKDGIPKLIDFGMANFIEISQVTHCNGSPIYMSPLNLKSQDYNLEKNDVWSLGLILYQLVEGKFPFKEELLSSQQDLIAAQEEIKFGLEFHNNVSYKLQNLIVNMLKYEENERYNWEQVIQHEIMAPYFQNSLNENLQEIDKLLTNYEQYLKLQESYNTQKLNKYILDLTLSKICHLKKSTSSKSEQDQKINQLFKDRFQQKRKFYGFKSENKLKNKLSQKLTKFIEEMILNNPDDEQIQYENFQIVVYLYKNDFKFENRIIVHKLLELAKF